MRREGKGASTLWQGRTGTGGGGHCFEETGRSRCGAEASLRQDWGRGAGVGLPGVPGGGDAASERAGSGLWGAPLSCCGRPGREPPAQVLWGSGCAQPGEERKTTGGEGGSGRQGASGGRGGPPPAWTGSARRGTQVPGPRGPRGQRRAQGPRPGRWSAPPPTPTPLRRVPGRRDGVG